MRYTIAMLILMSLILSEHAFGRSRSAYVRNGATGVSGMESVVITLKKNATKLEVETAKALKYLIDASYEKVETEISEITDNNFDFNINLVCRTNLSVSVKITCERDIATIEYSTPYDAPAAAGEFAKHVLGIKVFAPPPLGIEATCCNKFAPKHLHIEKRFSYTGRVFGMRQPECSLYNIANGENCKFELKNHNLVNIINSKAAEEHPEWLASGNGARQTYAVNSQTQIDFENIDARNFVRKAALEFFGNHKERSIFSATYADSYSFDQSSRTEAKRRHFTPNGYSDYGNLVFDFTNAIAKTVALNYQDKYVGELAYRYTENPPDFKMRKNIVVYLCADRANYFLKSERDKDLRLLEKWSESGVKLFGIYDYNYGMQYFVPRNTSGYISDAIKSAHKTGARLYTCESYPLWAYDAHKIWVMSNLLKDVDADPSELESEFFADYYKGAAPHIAKFFATAKNVWESRADNPIWLKLFKRESQAELFGETELALMESSLSRAEYSRVSDIVRQRIHEIRLVFDITKAFADSYRLRKKLFLYPPADTRNAARILDTLEAVSISETRKKLAVNRYIENTKYPKADFWFWKTASFIDASESVAAELLALAIPKISDKISEIFGESFVGLSNDLIFSKNILANSRFASGLDGWTKYQTGSCEETLFSIPYSSNMKSGFVEMSSLDFVGLSQSARVSEGKAYRASAGVSGSVKIGDVCYIRLVFSDKDGHTTGVKRQQLPSGYFSSKTLEVSARAPKGSVSATVSFFAGNMHPSNKIRASKIELSEGLGESRNTQ